MNPLEPLYSLPLNELPIVVVDLETTGLRPQLDAICEIGAVRIQGGVVLEQFTTLVNPQRDIVEEVVKIHKLTNDLLENAPLLEEVLPDFLKFLGSSIIAGHNAGFDVSFLAPASLKWGLDLYRYPILDTAYLARKLLPKQGSYALSQLASTFHLPNTRFHRALEDAMTTAHLLQLLFQTATEQKIETLAQLEKIYPFPGTPRPFEKMSPLEQTLWKAITHGLDIEILYRNRKFEDSQRRITPERLSTSHVHAHCHLRGEQRVFLLDRIEDYKLLDPTGLLNPLPKDPQDDKLQHN